ncbi:unnamed protein product [Microthlaspi erraticum]|uniref:Uncharacterized protein n=1 Tax=Microthlaspi erraticum TaxID=1685480 RepID=A0A6D2HM70_9BRAS|nr:unnamed protein product [Microthlaspi erraticum]
MKPESRRNKSGMSYEDESSFNLSSLRELIESSTGEKSGNLMDLSSMSHALSCVKRKMDQKKKRVRVRTYWRERASANGVMDLTPEELTRLSEELFKGLLNLLPNQNKASSSDTLINTEPQLVCSINKQDDFSDWVFV